MRREPLRRGGQALRRPGAAASPGTNPAPALERSARNANPPSLHRLELRPRRGLQHRRGLRAAVALAQHRSEAVNQDRAPRASGCGELASHASIAELVAKAMPCCGSTSRDRQNARRVHSGPKSRDPGPPGAWGAFIDLPANRRDSVCGRVCPANGHAARAHAISCSKAPE